MILLIDNYDSFSYNLAHLIGALGKDVVVKRNDAISAADAIGLGPEAIVLSPGPGKPESAGVCLDIVAAAAERSTPVFGVCLGMQAIAQHFGAVIDRAGRLMHGKTSQIAHDGAGLMTGLPNHFTATRYHSLSVNEKHPVPSVLRVTARAEDDNEIMAVEHADLPISGVQFHPESIASEHGARIIRNFLDRAGR